MKPYRILVVDDSPFMRKIITDLIEQDKSFWVERTAANGREALERIEELSPDLVTMDVEMPEMNGLEALRHIMKKHPVPVIMLSGINEQGMRETIMALELGAFDFIRKPSLSSSSQGIAEVGEALREQIRAAMLSKERRLAREQAMARQAEEPKAPPHPRVERPSALPPAVSELKRPKISPLPERAQSEPSEPKKPEVKQPLLGAGSTKAVDDVKVSSPKPPAAKSPAPKPPERNKPVEKATPEPKAEPVKREGSGRIAGQTAAAGGAAYTDIVAIGCSTGGPKALKTLLERIPGNFPAPIAIVQHMPPNFTKSLAQRLNSLCAVTVVEAEDGMIMEKGTAYIAPGGQHLTIAPGAGGTCKISLNQGELQSGHRPSVDVMFRSLLPLSQFRRHAALLTGMGSDGAKAMKQLYDAGVTSTFAESEETCVVYGMPRSAVELKCVSHVLPLQEIAPKLVQIVK